MKRILTEPAAAAVIVIDEAHGASMTEVARVSGRSLSTIQRGIGGLVAGGVLRRTTPRGPLVFRPDAPKGALRELATWTLGRPRARRLVDESAALRSSRTRVPPTVKNQAVRRFLPVAIGRIVEAYGPSRVILFGSYARGTATPDSDVDLLVVFDEEVERRERQVEIGRLLKDAPFSKDVLIARTADLPDAVRGTAIADAIHDGVVVYER